MLMLGKLTPFISIMMAGRYCVSRLERITPLHSRQGTLTTCDLICVSSPFTAVPRWTMVSILRALHAMMQHIPRYQDMYMGISEVFLAPEIPLRPTHE